MSGNSKEQKRFASLKAFGRRVFKGGKSRKQNAKPDLLSDDETNSRSQNTTNNLTESKRSQSHEVLSESQEAEKVVKAEETTSPVQSRIERLKNELSKQQQQPIQLPAGKKPSPKVKRLSHMPPAGLDKMLMMKNFSPPGPSRRQPTTSQPSSSNQQSTEEVSNAKPDDKDSINVDKQKDKEAEVKSTNSKENKTNQNAAAISRIAVRPNNRRAPTRGGKRPKPRSNDQGVDDFFTISDDVMAVKVPTTPEDKPLKEDKRSPEIEDSQMEKLDDKTKAPEKPASINKEIPTEDVSTKDAIASEKGEELPLNEDENVPKKEEVVAKKEEEIPIMEEIVQEKEEIFATTEDIALAEKESKPEENLTKEEEKPVKEEHIAKNEDDQKVEKVSAVDSKKEESTEQIESSVIKEMSESPTTTETHETNEKASESSSNDDNSQAEKTVNVEKVEKTKTDDEEPSKKLNLPAKIETQSESNQNDVPAEKIKSVTTSSENSNEKELANVSSEKAENPSEKSDDQKLKRDFSKIFDMAWNEQRQNETSNHENPECPQSETSISSTKTQKEQGNPGEESQKETTEKIVEKNNEAIVEPAKSENDAQDDDTKTNETDRRKSIGLASAESNDSKRVSSKNAETSEAPGSLFSVKLKKTGRIRNNSGDDEVKVKQIKPTTTTPCEENPPKPILRSSTKKTTSNKEENFNNNNNVTWRFERNNPAQNPTDENAVTAQNPDDVIEKRDTSPAERENTSPATVKPKIVLRQSRTSLTSVIEKSDAKKDETPKEPPLVRLRRIKSRSSQKSTESNESVPEWVAKAKRHSVNWEGKFDPAKVKKPLASSKSQEYTSEKPKLNSSKRLSVPLVKLSEDNFELKLDATERVKSPTKPLKTRPIAHHENSHSAATAQSNAKSNVPSWMELARKKQKDWKDAKFV